jgi:hypothetical protein
MSQALSDKRRATMSTSKPGASQLIKLEKALAGASSSAVGDCRGRLNNAADAKWEG